jgi:hypothetical protein
MVDALIAVHVGIADVPPAAGVSEQGFASISMRAAMMMMHAQRRRPALEDALLLRS